MNEPEEPTAQRARPAVRPEDLLGEAARSIGAGSATDIGWSSPMPAGIARISMSGGFPDPGAVPVEALLGCLQAVMREAAPEAMRYGGTLGFEPLRRALAHKSQRDDGLAQGPENFLITNGSSAGIDLIARTFLNPGDVVLCESPTFSGSLRTFRGLQARFQSVPVDADGMVVDELERALAALAASGSRAKLIYTIPDFHNPTGTMLSRTRRRRCIEVAGRYGALIVEDAAYSDLSYEEEPCPSIYALAGGEGVIRAGSFSKTVATGLRVGWLQAGADFITACDQMRFDMGGSPLLHRALAAYLDSGRWDEHVAEMRELYSQKCAVFCEALLDECEPYLRFQRPLGGYFLWVECAEGISARAVATMAAEQGLACVSGSGFYLDREDDRHIRLAFTHAALAELPEAARRLRRAFERAAE